MQPYDAVLALAVALLLCGALTATTSSNPLKRAAGVTLALLGAVASLAAMRISPNTLMAGVGVAFALAALGVALAIRLHEAYAGNDVADYDAADQSDAAKAPPP